MPDAPAPVNDEKARKFWPPISPASATHLLESGSGIRTAQELLGHSNVETTMIYTHMLNRPDLAPVKSPLDQ